MFFSVAELAREYIAVFGLSIAPAELLILAKWEAEQRIEQDPGYFQLVQDIIAWDPVELGLAAEDWLGRMETE